MTGVVNGAVGYHDARGVPLRTLNTSFVVSTRADKAIGGNSFTPTRFSAPAGPMDPADRFKALSEAMADKRAQVTAGSGALRRPRRDRQPAADVARHQRRPLAGGEDGLRHVQPAQLEAALLHVRGRVDEATGSGRSPARRST